MLFSIAKVKFFLVKDSFNRLGGSVKATAFFILQKEIKMTKAKKLIERIKAFFHHEYIVIYEPIIIKVSRVVNGVEFVDPIDDIVNLDVGMFLE